MQRVRPTRAKAKPTEAHRAWLARRRRHPMAPARAGEIIPRRDHILRLAYVAAGGLVLMALLFAALDALLPRVPASPRAVVLGAFVGWLAGRVQAKWLWSDTVPAPIWAAYSALGWAAGAALLPAADLLLKIMDPAAHGFPAELFALILMVAGAAAGLVAGAQQARVLRWHDLDGGWWIAASTAATSIGWSIWFILALMVM